MSAYIPDMSRHAHHEHSGDKLVEEAEAVLTAAGEQWTGMRADVIAVDPGFELVTVLRGGRILPGHRHAAL